MIHTSCFNIRPEVAGHSLTDAASFKKILKLWCALVMAKFFCSCERASARQNVSPEGREGGEDTGVCGNIFQSRLSLESAQKSRHRILGKIQTHFLKTCMDWTFLFYKSSSLFFHSPSPSSAAKESWECAELWKRLHRLEPEFGCGNTQQFIVITIINIVINIINIVINITETILTVTSLSSRLPPPVQRALPRKLKVILGIYYMQSDLATYMDIGQAEARNNK